MCLEGARLERSIGSLTIAERWTLRSEDGSTGMAYRLHERPTPRALVRLRSLAGQGLSHCVPIESVVEDDARRVWLVAPYLGETISETLGLYTQGPDRTWRWYADDVDR